MSRVFYVLFHGCAGMKEQGQRLCPLLFQSCSFWTICHGVVYVPARIKEQGQRLNISAQRGNHLNWELRRDFNHSWHASPVFALNPDPPAQKTRTLPDWANQAVPFLRFIFLYWNHFAVRIRLLFFLLEFIKTFTDLSFLTDINGFLVLFTSSPMCDLL